MSSLHRFNCPFLPWSDRFPLIVAVRPRWATIHAVTGKLTLPSRSLRFLPGFQFIGTENSIHEVSADIPAAFPSGVARGVVS